MDSYSFVLITLLALPNGDSTVHIKPFDTAAACVEAARIDQTDPFVAHAECSELTDGSLTLSFRRNPPPSGTERPGKAAS